MKNITKINLWMDVILLTVFLMTGVSGLILWQGFPHGAGGSLAEFGGLSKHEWENFHVYTAIILLAQGFIHLALHWTWIVTVARRLFRRTSAQARRNFALDSLLFVPFALACVSGLILWLVPGGIHQAVSQAGSTLPASRIWKDVHEWSGLSMIVLALLHFGLHVRWMAAQMRSVFRIRICKLEPSKPLQRP